MVFKTSFLLFSIYFVFLGTDEVQRQQVKTLASQFSLSLIRICIKKASGSGSVLRKSVGSASAQNECGSTALLIILFS